MSSLLTGEFLGLSKYSYKTFSKKPGADEIHERVSCPICHRSEVDPHWDCGDFAFSRCVGCGHVYQNPRPVGDDLIERYDEEYRDYEVENSQNFFTLMRYGLRDAGVFSITNHLLTRRESKPRALDVGCATGVLVRYLNDLGWDAEGLEVCAPAARFGMDRRNVLIHINTLEGAGLSDGHYDLVHFSHVIEHLPDVNAFLAEVRRICRPGGHVVITTPNRKSFQAAIMGAKWRSAIADHTHLFSTDELLQLLKRHGFEPVKQKTWGGIPVGMAPGPLKRIVDRIARIIGYGDVVMVMGRRIS
jgi:2-polyprenyl-3-methyl-5-hydroxy-6-metoxy-1,4-benzoquinol methylase